MCQTRCCNSWGLKCWATVAAGLAIAFFSIALYLPPYIDGKLSDGIDNIIIIDAQKQADNDKYYRTFVNPDDPDSTALYYKVYLWHCTNCYVSPAVPSLYATSVLNGNKPNFTEVGPYVYRKKVYKNNVVYSKNVYLQDIVTYQTQTAYEYNAGLSCTTCSESDMVTNVNLVYAGLQGTATPAGIYSSATLANGNPAADFARFFQTRNVSEWLWGYADPAWAYLGNAGGTTAFPQPFPALLGYNQQSPWQYQPQDIQFVGTKPDSNLVRTYVQYQGQVSLKTRVIAGNSPVGNFPIAYVDTWASGLANRVFGSDGTQFPRGVDDGAVVNAYVSQLTRTVTLENLNSVKIKFKDIDMLHFTLPYIYLGNATEFPANADFYMFGYRGVANLTATGKPDFYVTKPHYLDCDPAIINSMNGVSAGTIADHDTFLNVEPISGLTMQAAKRLQLSIRIHSYNTTAYVSTSPYVWGAGLPAAGQYMPVYWAEESGEISDSSADDFSSSVYGAQRASTGLYIAGEVLGCFFTVLAVVLMWISFAKEAPAGTSLNSP